MLVGCTVSKPCKASHSNCHRVDVMWEIEFESEKNCLLGGMSVFM